MARKSFKNGKPFAVVIVLLILFIFASNSMFASSYRTYLHDPLVPEAPPLKLQGSFETKLWPEAGIDLISQVYHGASMFDGTVDWGRTGVAAGIGAAAGATFGAAGAAVGGGIFGTSISGISGGVAGQVVSNVLLGSPFYQNVGRSGAIGGLTAGGLRAGGNAVGSSLVKSTSTSVGRNIPNPYGKLGGPSHQGVVSNIQQSIKNRGLIPVSEYPIRNQQGKITRYVDVAGFDKPLSQGGKLVELHQVGKTTQSGLPVSRERAAITDIVKYTSKEVIYHPYDR